VPTRATILIMKDKKGFSSVAALVLIGLFSLGALFVYRHYQIKPVPIQPTPAQPIPKEDVFRVQTNSDYNRCFDYMDAPKPEFPTGEFVQPDMAELSSRCPIFLIDEYKDEEIGPIFETDEGIAIFQGGSVYSLSKDMPTFGGRYNEQVSSDSDTVVPRDILTDSNVTVTLGGKPYEARLIVFEYCLGDDQSECHILDEEKGILLQLVDHGGYWFEVIGEYLGTKIDANNPNATEIRFEQVQYPAF
jgi:hypothetical protein